VRLIILCFFLQVVGELWRPAGGAYNVDGVLAVMVSGLDEELKARMSGSNVYAANRKSPSRPITMEEAAEASVDSSQKVPVVQQGGVDIGYAWRNIKRVAKWVVGRRSR
jgi:hypothetical protein